MRIDTTIPEAVHLCPGGEHVASGALYCEECQHVAAFYDNLLTKTGYSVAGGTSQIEDEDAIPGAPSWRELAALAAYVGYVAWASAFGWAVHYIWQHWK